MAQQREPIVSIFQRIKAPFTEADDEPAAAAPQPRPVGEMLRERRQELRLDINDIGEVLRIKPAFLAALEENRPQDLPGPTYVLGFVRAYARHLGLDHDWVLERYKAESAAVQARPDLAFPVPLGERSVPGGPILLVALILAICGYGTWYYLSTGDRARPERVSAVPPALQMQPENAAAPDAAGAVSAAKPATDPAAPANSPAASANLPANSPGNSAANSRLSSGLFPGSAAAPASPATAAPPAADAGTTAPAKGSPPQPGGATAAATPQIPGSATPPPSAAIPVQTALAAPQSPPAAAPATDGIAGAAGRIEIKAAADCWVQVRAPDQSIVFSRVLKAGETYRVPARSGLVLRTGNAGALAINVDGKQVPAIGPPGALRRNVALDPEALIGGTAVQG
jgi:cytoskeleton protein RodZ